MKKYYSIKEIADLTGLSEHALRFYEKQKLIVNVKRDNNNYRLYSDFDILWIDFLTKVKNTGMPIKDIRKYAELMAQGNSTILEREKMLLEHQERIEKQIESLNNTLVQIKKKLERYQRIKEGIGEKDLELYEALSKKTNKSR